MLRHFALTSLFMNIIEHSDEEILAVAHPMWDDLIKYSNRGQNLFVGVLNDVYAASSVSPTR